MKFAHLLGHLHATFLRHHQFIFLQKVKSTKKTKEIKQPLTETDVNQWVSHISIYSNKIINNNIQHKKQPFTFFNKAMSLAKLLWTLICSSTANKC